MSQTRTALTPEERVTAAYMHIVLGVEQQHIAMAMAVNMGRVNEAIQGIRVAINDPKGTVARANGSKAEARDG